MRVLVPIEYHSRYIDDRGRIKPSARLLMRSLYSEFEYDCRKCQVVDEYGWITWEYSLHIIFFDDVEGLQFKLSHCA